MQPIIKQDLDLINLQKESYILENNLNNNNEIFDNIKKNLDINKININSHKEIKISDIHKTKMKSSERIKEILIYN